MRHAIGNNVDKKCKVTFIWKVFSEAHKEKGTTILQTVVVPSQRNQLLLVKGKYNVTILSVAVPSLNLIVL